MKHSTVKNLHLKLITGAVMVAMGNAAHAQVDKDDIVAAENGAVEEIVVTAQYRSENLQRVPLAISSVSGDDLTASGIRDLTGLSASVPGLYLSSYSVLSPQLFIRGVGSNDDGITSEGAVGVYIDGVYAGRGSSALFDLFDLARVEVLRGPQGTLYGRNTNGGAIKIETTKPGPDFHAALEAGLGNFNQRSVRGLVSGPLGNTVFAKLSGSYKNRDGWTRDLATQSKLNDEDSLSLRGQIRVEPTSTFEAVISLDYARDRPTSTFKDVVGGSLFGLYQESSDPFEGSYDLTDAFIRRDIIGASATFNWDVGSARLSAVAGYRKTDIHYTEDYDSTPFPVAHFESRQKAQQFTQEVRIVSKEGNSAISYILGVFYLKDRGRGYDQFNSLYFGLDSQITQANAHTSSIAVFGELSYRLTSKLKMTLGTRYTHERKRLAVQRTYDPLGGSPPFDFVPLTKTGVSFDNFSPRLVVEYQASDAVLGYASATRGFKSGGFNNYPADIVAAVTAFSPEKVTAYEVGIKATALERRLRLNTAAFYYDYSDLQVFAPIDTGSAVPVLQVTNAAKARIKGLEIEAVAVPIPGLTFEISFAHLLSQYRRFQFNAIDLSGRRLPRAPKDTIRFSAEWEGRFTGSAEFRLRGEYVYSSTLFFTPFNDPVLQSGKVGLFNASASVSSEDGRWTLTAYGRNLSNKRYLGHGIDALADFFDLKTGQLAAPRQYGLTLGWRY